MTRLELRHSTGHIVMFTTWLQTCNWVTFCDPATQWPGNPATRRPSWPGDPVLLWTPNVDLCCRQTFAMGKKKLVSFYRCLAFARFWKVKFWRSFIKCQYFNDGWADFHKYALYRYIFIMGFFRKSKKTRISHRVKMMTRWPDDLDVKDDPNDPLTRRPNDPGPCLLG